MARLLLVDDDVRNLGILEAMLRPLNLELFRATGGREALEVLPEVKPDLMLLDYAMPGFDGIDVLTHLRSDPEFCEVAVIIVTAYSERERRIRGFEAGADEFLEKPIDAAALRARVRTLLRLRESRQALLVSHADLARRHAELEALQREQQELMEFLVHDLKNPLSVVCGNLDYVCERASSMGEVGEALEDARSATLAMRDLIQDLLAVSRLESSEFPLRVEAVNVTDLVQSVAASYERKAERTGVHLQLPSSGPMRASADPRLLRRVVENVVDNSLRYTPPGGHVAFRCSPKLRSGGTTRSVELTISNDGPPIPRDQRKRIFDKFARLSPEGIVPSNAGIGLYFCKRALEAQGGDIAVADLPDWSTTFSVTLPGV